MSKPQIQQSGLALVIGASGGLGSAIVRRMAGDWGNMMITYRSNRTKAEDLCAELADSADIDAVELDLATPDGLDTVFDAVAEHNLPLRSVVYASGVPIPQPYASATTNAQWDEVIQVELMGFIKVVARALPQLRAAGGGNIVNIGSFATRWFPQGDVLSAVPKAGTEMLCRAVAKEEGRFGIRANTVAPGIIDAGLGSELMNSILTPDIWDEQKKKVPLKRFGLAEDIANAAAFLSSDQAAYITGQTLIIDGGLSL